MVFDPTTKQVSTTGFSLTDIIVDDVNWEELDLVEPRNKALYSQASRDPFKAKDVDWKERESAMLKLMHDKLGVGLANNQVGGDFRMFVMEHSVLGDIGVYNPVILEREGEVTMKEGCLTWPLLYINITRPENIRVRYTKTDGETDVETWMDGMDARCFQHELDHLNGINYFDHVSELKLQRAKQKRDKLLKKLDRINVA